MASRRARLREPRRSAIAERLAALEATVDPTERVAADPVRFAHRYTAREDVEIAAIVAALYAFGNAKAFGNVLESWFQHADTHGGPRAFLETFDADTQRAHLPKLAYRWFPTPQVAWLLAGMRDLLEHHGSFEAVFQSGYDPNAADLHGCLMSGVGALHTSLVRVSPRFHPDPITHFEQLPDGLARFVTAPAKRSACKRWNLALRWLIRPADGVDLGLWTWARPAQLTIPLDVHVSRISRFLGLTHRKNASWDVAAEITSNLRRVDPNDPIRYDFYLSHLGISGKCPGHRETEACTGCRLAPVCRAPKAAASR
jgi:uncharacterized protein (TIGR02757 family)